MPTTQDTAKLLDLKRRFEKLPPAEQVLVAAGLITEGKYDLAETILSNIVDELRALRLLRRA